MSAGKKILIALTILLLAEAAGLAIAPVLIGIISGWLLAWPPPTEHFASLLGALAWPSALLLVVYTFRRPLRTAAYYLARRFKTDKLKAGIFEVDAATSLIPLKELDRGQMVMERLWEFAGASDDNWDRLLSWIARNIAAGVELEDFLAESIFAPERELAYTELVEGI